MQFLSQCLTVCVDSVNAGIGWNALYLFNYLQYLFNFLQYLLTFCSIYLTFCSNCRVGVLISGVLRFYRVVNNLH
jgi:hypothetical protein